MFATMKDEDKQVACFLPVRSRCINDDGLNYDTQTFWLAVHTAGHHDVSYDFNSKNN